MLVAIAAIFGKITAKNCQFLNKYIERGVDRCIIKGCKTQSPIIVMMKKRNNDLLCFTAELYVKFLCKV